MMEQQQLQVCHHVLRLAHTHFSATESLTYIITEILNINISHWMWYQFQRHCLNRLIVLLNALSSKVMKCMHESWVCLSQSEAGYCHTSKESPWLQVAISYVQNMFIEAYQIFMWHLAAKLQLVHCNNAIVILTILFVIWVARYRYWHTIVLCSIPWDRSN